MIKYGVNVAQRVHCVQYMNDNITISLAEVLQSW